MRGRAEDPDKNVRQTVGGSMSFYKEYDANGSHSGVQSGAKCFQQVGFASVMDDFRFCSALLGTERTAVNSLFHWHEYIELLYCVEGIVPVTADNAEYLLQAGDLLLIGPNVMHKTYKAEGVCGVVYNILFDAAILQSVNYCSLENKCIQSFLSYLSSFQHHYIEGAKLTEGFGELITKMHQRYHSYQVYNSIYIKAYLLEFIGKLCENGYFQVETTNISKQTIDAIQGTLDYINVHYKEKITLADMAEKANLSYYYYSKLFKMVTGKTFVAFLASVRVFMAEKLMLMGKYTMQEVADQVGLYPQSNFTHTYKRLRGFSPNEFMKRVER